MIEQLNREQFEVLVFRLGVSTDAVTQFIRQHADRMIDLPYVLEQAQQQIAAQEPDVLLFTDIGFDALTYYLAHARLAPLQCVTWGHPLTTGIPTLDCFISSEALDLPDAQAQYTERLVRLPHMVPYYFRPDFPPSTKGRADFGLPTAERLYGCLQVMFKIHPDDDAVFAEILRRDPGAPWCCCKETFRIGRGCSKRASAGRFPTWPSGFTLPSSSHRATSRTCCRCSTPCWIRCTSAAATRVTNRLPAAVRSSRCRAYSCAAASRTALYQAMGLTECVARDEQDYVERALRLANDRPWHAARQAEILAANQAIFQNVAGVRELEQFLSDAVAGK